MKETKQDKRVTGESSWAPAVSPRGKLYLRADAEGEATPRMASYPERCRTHRLTEGALSGAQVAAILRAFAGGCGAGLLHLGAADADTALPPAFAYWREFGRKFVTAMCLRPDLETEREKMAVPPPERDALERLAQSAPPMVGSEYLNVDALAAMWDDMAAAFRAEIAAFAGPVQTYLQQKNRIWNLVGRVCFHLAENKHDPAAPFAFLATYTTRLSAQARVQHLPLGKALEEYAGAKNRAALLSLLTPVQKAAAQSPLVNELVESGEIFHPLAWTPKETYRFLKDIPVYETCGVVVRVPNWWNPRRPARPQVSVTVGQAAARLGANALLDFSVSMTLEGETLTKDEWQQIMASTDGLALIRGKWVEIDREKLSEALAHWKRVEKSAGRDGVSFIEGMRLLAGVRDGGAASATEPAGAAAWSSVAAGEWLAGVMRGLKDPDGLRAADPGASLKTRLRPYQETGVRWLWFVNRLGINVCLADDMGLGKTIQMLALLLLLKQKSPGHKTLLVVPASLISNWKSESRRFAPDLNLFIAHPSAMDGGASAVSNGTGMYGAADLVVTTYGSLYRYEWLCGREWDLAVLDEAQAIKNPGARQTRAAKAIKAGTRIVLTGTPIENRLSDLWSIFDFLCPGLLGSAKMFGSFVKSLAARSADSAAAPAPSMALAALPPSGRSENPYGPLRNLVRPYILRRLKTDKQVISDLPEKTEMRAYCSLSKTQAALYQKSVAELADRITRADEGIKRRGLILSFLLRFKQICNHPSHWLADGRYDPADSGKFARLREIGDEMAAKQEKALVFTQFREMTEPLAHFLAGVFGRPGLVMHGQTQVLKRKALVDEFQSEAGPPFFVLSLKVGGMGLNLTAATQVIHFDRWWNPAVETQATDRAFRIGQKRNVVVHKFVCRGTVEEKIDELIRSKESLSREILDVSAESALTEMSNEDLLRFVALDITSALDDA